MKQLEVFILNSGSEVSKHTATLLLQDGCHVLLRLPNSDNSDQQKTISSNSEGKSFASEASQESRKRAVIWFPPPMVFSSQHESPTAMVDIIDQSLNDAFLSSKRAVDHLSRTGGSIVLATSGKPKSVPMQFAEDVAVGGVALLARSLSRHCAEKNYDIRVNSALGRRPDGTWASPQQYAKSICFLASSHSSFINGAEFPA